jgi:hypothetical protein
MNLDRAVLEHRYSPTAPTLVNWVLVHIRRGNPYQDNARPAELVAVIGNCANSSTKRQLRRSERRLRGLVAVSPMTQSGQRRIMASSSPR